MSNGQLPSIKRGLVIIVAVIVYYALAHLIATSDRPGFLGVMLALSPFIFFIGIYAWRARFYVLCALCVLAFVPLWIAREFLAEHVEWVYLLQSVTGDLALALLFGSTLRAGRTPLCTEMALLAYAGKLPDKVLPYTRHITIAWTVFFGTVCATSLSLFFFAPKEVWSVFANLLTIPLVALMFVLEYAVRVRTFPHLERKGVLSALRAYWALEAEKLKTAQLENRHLET